MGEAGKGRSRNTGRPPKISQRPDPGNPQTYGDRVIEALNAGAFLDDACAYAGISRTAAYESLSKGKDARAIVEEHGKAPDTLTDNQRAYLDFANAVEKARATVAVQSLAVIRQAAAKGTWQAAAWYLERTMPHKFGRFQRPDDEVQEVTLTAESAKAALLGLDDGSDGEA
jgi:hypothetical protein